MSTSDNRALVQVRFDGALAEIALDNPPLNLVTRPLLRALHRAIDEVAANTALRCVIVHGGESRAFCAGSDINEFAGLRENASEHKILVEDMVLRRLARLSTPTIAAIDGPALGGGFELALACDLRVCRKGAALGLPESRLGGLAGSGSVRLTRLVGPARAKEMLFTGETITTEQALAWGLVNRVVPAAQLDAEIRRFTDIILARSAAAIRMGKAAFYQQIERPLAGAYDFTAEIMACNMALEDASEGIDAFLQKRPAVWRGR